MKNAKIIRQAVNVSLELEDTVLSLKVRNGLKSAVKCLCLDVQTLDKLFCIGLERVDCDDEIDDARPVVVRRVHDNKLEVCLNFTLEAGACFDACFQVSANFPAGIDSSQLFAQLVSGFACDACDDVAKGRSNLVLLERADEYPVAGAEITGRVVQAVRGESLCTIDNSDCDGSACGAGADIDPCFDQRDREACQCGNFVAPDIDCCEFPEPDEAVIVYVDCKSPAPQEENPNLGTSWPQAYTSLAAAITASPPDAEIWVAQGRYLGLHSIATGKSIYGGFLGNAPCGNETRREQRSHDCELTVLDGAGVTNVVSVVAPDSDNVLLDGLRITNGQDVVGGGVYIISGNTYLTNVLFDYNVATARGGAVYHSEAQNLLRICKCKFEHNTCTGLNALDGGGAIASFNSGTVDVRSSTFLCNDVAENEQSVATGGAILMAAGTLDARDCLFEKNVSRVRGGAIDAAIANVTLRLTDCAFVRNGNSSTQVGSGGAVHCAPATTLVVYDCRFERNLASDGGAVSLSGNAAAQLTKSIFEYNVASNGAGVFLTQNVFLEVCHSKFQGNVSTRGAAIFSQGVGELRSTMIIGNSEFCCNAANSGGALYNANNSDATLRECTFLKNECGLQGGAVLTIEQSTLRVSGCTFELNNVISTSNAVSGGGALSVSQGASCQAKDSLFVRNSAEFGGQGSSNSSGGAVHVFDSSLSVDRCRFVSNFGDRAGGAIEINLLAGTGLLIRDSEFCNNKTGQRPGNGGAINYTSLGETNADNLIRNCVFRNNTAASIGGAVTTPDDGETDFQLCTFSKNLSNLGGAMVFGRGRTNIVRCLFDENTANIIGGAIFNVGETVICCSRFSENRAVVNGGAVSHGGESMYMAHNCFTENASGVGGAIYLSEFDSARIYNTEFHKNRANSEGGALRVNSFANGSLVMANLLFVANKAVNGAAMSFEGESTTPPTMYNVTASRNYASAAGGALSVQGSFTVDVSNSIFYGNDAPVGSEIDSQGLVRLTSSIVAPNGINGATTQANVKSDDPQFVDALQNYRLRECSPARDCGVTLPGDLSLPAVDLDTYARTVGVIDLGAYEIQAGAADRLVQLTGTDCRGACVAKQTRTIADGTFVFDGLPEGSYKVALLSETNDPGCPCDEDMQHYLRDYPVELCSKDDDFAVPVALGAASVPLLLA